MYILPDASLFREHDMAEQKQYGFRMEVDGVKRELWFNRTTEKQNWNEFL